MIKVYNIRSAGEFIPNSVYCGRPSKWGNPFITGKDGNRTQVILLHKEWILNNPTLIQEAKTELRGKNLACWCAPKPCHCDIIFKIANEVDIFNFM